MSRRVFLIAVLACVFALSLIAAPALAGVCQISFTSSNFTVTEGDGSATITVVRNAECGTSSSQSFSINPGGGTATGGGPNADYTAGLQSVTIAAGQTQGTASIPIADDSEAESVETVSLALVNMPTGATAGPGATLAIQDNDSSSGQTLSLTTSSATVNEGAGTVTLGVTRSGGTTGTVTVQYTTSNGSATAGSDYTTTSGTLTFGPGVATRPIAIPITDDTTTESSETFTVTLSSPTGGASLVSPSTATVTIADNDSGSQTIQLSASAYSLAESDGTITISVTRSSTTGARSVDYTTSNGTAIAGTDYSTSAGTLAFAAGEATKTFSVTVIDDSTDEGNETVTITLSNPTGGATLGSPSTGTLTIVDDDEPAPSESYSRSVSLTLKGHLTAKGTVKVEAGGDSDCLTSVTVKIQRRKNGAWRTVKTATTGSSGFYKKSLGDKKGKYRAKAPSLTTTDGDSCQSAKSSTKRHRH